MANFKTHIAVGTVATGFLATMTMAASVVTPNQVMSLALAGALGSVLPDMDLQNSRASRAIFFALALFLAFCVLFAFGWQYSILEMWLIWVAVFAGVAYLGQLLFHKFAEHRGIFHSLLAGIFFMFLTAAIFFHIFNVSGMIAWLAGAFMLFGYIVHLILDEIYSVDFNNTRIKKSFGTALKIFEYRKPVCSLLMLTVTILAFYVTPPGKDFTSEIGSHDKWAFLGEKMLPHGSLFGIHQKLQHFADYINGYNTNLGQGTGAQGTGRDGTVNLLPTGSLSDGEQKQP